MKRTRRAMRWGLTMAMLGLLAALVTTRPLPVRAQTGTVAWADPTAIATGLTDAARPALAYTSDGVGHAVWESNSELYYAAQRRGEPWTTAVQIAYGMSPALAVDSEGQLHALFANQFMGNYEIYVIDLVDGAWSLPVDISHTSGISAFPVVTAGADRTLYAAWMDNSPGYWTIYVGHWNGEYWSSQPVANARGQAPALATTPEGTVYLAWQDRTPSVENPSGAFDIFLSEQSGTDWSLPIDVSDSPNVESIGASLTTTADGLAHLTWIDGDQEVRYCYGRELYWPLPQTVSKAATIARGSRITSEAVGQLHIAWDEGDIVRVSSAPSPPLKWPKASFVTALVGDLRDVSITALPNGGITVGWVQTFHPGDVGVYESQPISPLHPRIWLPVITRHE
jgi:hypothetical protein